MEYPIQPDSLCYGDCREAVAAKGKVMPSALSYGCKCQHFGQQHALLTAAKCPHALILIDVQEGLDDPHLGAQREFAPNSRSLRRRARC